MIKVFEWGSKLNVVDDDNNFVGFDLADDCCAHGGYFIAKSIHTKDFNVDNNEIKDTVEDKEFDKYYFSEDFFEEHDNVGEGRLVSTTIVVFKFDHLYQHVYQHENCEHPPLYLHLFNVHNGYYAKGFKCTFGHTREGSI